MLAPLVLAAAIVSGPVPVDAKLLEGKPRAKAELNFQGGRQSCEGVLLTAVLASLGAPSHESLRGGEMTRTVTARARDGYAVTFSLGELDETLGNKQVIIADTCDGKPLGPEFGPYRLVVPGDSRPGRSVFQLATIEIK